MDITINTQKSDAIIPPCNKLYHVYQQHSHRLRTYMHQRPKITKIIAWISIVTAIYLLHFTLLAALAYAVIYSARQLNRTCAPANKFLFRRHTPNNWSMQCSPLGVGFMIDVVYTQHHTHIMLDFLQEHHRVSTPLTVKLIST